MAHNASRELFIHSLLSVGHARRTRDNRELVSRNIGTFLTSTDVYSYSSHRPNIPHTGIYYNPSVDMHSCSSDISNIPHTNIYSGPLSLGTPLQQFSRGNTLLPLGTLEYPDVEQPQALQPVPATNTSLHDWPPSTSRPHSRLGPHPQSQERAESGLLGVSFCANTSFGPPLAAAATNLRRDESEPQATTLPSR